jgi:hypothetical protein
MSRPVPPDPDRTRLDVHPMDEPPPVVERRAEIEYPAAAGPAVTGPAVEEETVDSYARRVSVVRKVCTVITMICGLFALVLAVHIVLVLAEANPNNGFASFINSFSGGVSLGLRNLFTPDSQKLRVFLNDGVAAIGWLVLGAALTYGIRQFALPGPRRSVRYRRVVR